MSSPDESRADGPQPADDEAAAAQRSMPVTVSSPDDDDEDDYADTSDHSVDV